MSQILIVDDDPMYRQLFSETFELIGMKTIIVGSGADALEKLRETVVPLILLDLQMPGMSGFDLINRIRDDERYNTVKIIVISGDRQAADSPEVQQADLFLAKPVHIDHLLKQVQTLLRS